MEMASSFMCCLIMAAIIFAGEAVAPLNTEAESDDLVVVVNAILSEVPQARESLIVLTERNSKLGDVSKLRAPGGVGIFEAPEANQNPNVTKDHISAMVRGARQIRLMLNSVTVVVVSDDPAFLTTFTKWSLKGRLLVWSTRLLVLTRLPLHRLHHLRNTLAITNSILLKLTHTPLRVSLYMAHPYSSPDSQLRPFASWSVGSGLRKESATSLFADKFLQLSNRPRLVVSRVVLPYENKEEIDDPQHPGERKLVTYTSENQLIETIGEAMNFTVNFISPADEHWGQLDGKGGWTGMIGMVHKKEADIGLGFFTMTPARTTVVDFTSPVTVSYARILSGRKSPEVSVWAFFAPMYPQVWLGILLSLGVYVVVLLLPSYLHVQALNTTRLMTSANNCVRVLLQQDVCKTPGWWWWERVVVGVWMLMTLVLTRSYAGNLMSQLAVRNVPEPYQSLEDLLNNPVTVVFLEGTAEESAFRFAEWGIKREVWNLRDQNRLSRIHPSELVSIQQDIVEGDLAFINLESYHRKMMESHFNVNGQCFFNLGRSRYIPALESMAGAKDSPLVPALSRKVLQVIEGGLFSYWGRRFFPNLTYCLHVPTKFAAMSTLGMENLWGMFVILAGGWLISLVVLGMELYLGPPSRKLPGRRP